MPWPELVKKFSEQDHGPVEGSQYGSLENLENYWNNQIDVREVFLMMIERLRKKKVQGISHLQIGYYGLMNHFAFMGRSGKSPYRPPTLPRGADPAWMAGKFHAVDVGQEILEEKNLERFAIMLFRLKEFAALDKADKNRDIVILLAAEVFFEFMSRFWVFEYINNSIGMNVLNGMLRLHGMNGISHGKLDQLAALESPKEPFFREAFEMIRDANPDLHIDVNSLMEQERQRIRQAPNVHALLVEFGAISGSENPRYEMRGTEKTTAYTPQTIDRSLRSPVSSVPSEKRSETREGTAADSIAFEISAEEVDERLRLLFEFTEEYRADLFVVGSLVRNLVLRHILKDNPDPGVQYFLKSLDYHDIDLGMKRMTFPHVNMFDMLNNLDVAGNWGKKYQLVDLNAIRSLFIAYPQIALSGFRLEKVPAQDRYRVYFHGSELERDAVLKAIRNKTITMVHGEQALRDLKAGLKVEPRVLSERLYRILPLWAVFKISGVFTMDPALDEYVGLLLNAYTEAERNPGERKLLLAYVIEKIRPIQEQALADGNPERILKHALLQIGSPDVAVKAFALTPDSRLAEPAPGIRENFLKRRALLDKLEIPTDWNKNTYWNSISQYLAARLYTWSQEPMTMDQPEWNGMSFDLFDAGTTDIPLERRPRIHVSLEIEKSQRKLTAAYLGTIWNHQLLGSDTIRGKIAARLATIAEAFGAKLEITTARSEARNFKVEEQARVLATHDALIKEAAAIKSMIDEASIPVQLARIDAWLDANGAKKNEDFRTDRKSIEDGLELLKGLKEKIGPLYERIHRSLPDPKDPSPRYKDPELIALSDENTVFNGKKAESDLFHDMTDKWGKLAQFAGMDVSNLEMQVVNFLDNGQDAPDSFVERVRRNRRFAQERFEAYYLMLTDIAAPAKIDMVRSREGDEARSFPKYIYTHFLLPAYDMITTRSEARAIPSFKEVLASMTYTGSVSDPRLWKRSESDKKYYDEMINWSDEELGAALRSFFKEGVLVPLNDTSLLKIRSGEEFLKRFIDHLLYGIKVGERKELVGQFSHYWGPANYPPGSIMREGMEQRYSAEKFLEYSGRYRAMLIGLVEYWDRLAARSSRSAAPAKRGESPKAKYAAKVEIRSKGGPRRSEMRSVREARNGVGNSMVRMIDSAAKYFGRDGFTSADLTALGFANASMLMLNAYKKEYVERTGMNAKSYRYRLTAKGRRFAQANRDMHSGQDLENFMVAILNNPRILPGHFTMPDLHQEGFRSPYKTVSRAMSEGYIRVIDESAAMKVFALTKDGRDAGNNKIEECRLAGYPVPRMIDFQPRHKRRTAEGTLLRRPILPPIATRLDDNRDRIEEIPADDRNAQEVADVIRVQYQQMVAFLEKPENQHWVGELKIIRETVSIPERLEQGYPTLLKGKKLNITQAAKTLGVSASGLFLHLQRHPDDSGKYEITPSEIGFEPKIPGLLEEKGSLLMGMGLNISEAAEKLVISRQALSFYLREHPEYFEKYGILRLASRGNATVAARSVKRGLSLKADAEELWMEWIQASPVLSAYVTRKSSILVSDEWMTPSMLTGEILFKMGARKTRFLFRIERSRMRPREGEPELSSPAYYISKLMISPELPKGPGGESLSEEFFRVVCGWLKSKGYPVLRLEGLDSKSLPFFTRLEENPKLKARYDKEKFIFELDLQASDLSPWYDWMKGPLAKIPGPALRSSAPPGLPDRRTGGRSEMRSRKTAAVTFGNILHFQFPNKKELRVLDVGFGEGEFFYKIRDYLRDAGFLPEISGIDNTLEEPAAAVLKAQGFNVEAVALIDLLDRSRAAGRIPQSYPVHGPFDLIFVTSPDALLAVDADYMRDLLTPDGLEVWRNYKISGHIKQQNDFRRYLTKEKIDFLESSTHFPDLPAGSDTFAEITPPTFIKKTGDFSAPFWQPFAKQSTRSEMREGPAQVVPESGGKTFGIILSLADHLNLDSINRQIILGLPEEAIVFLIVPDDETAVKTERWFLETKARQSRVILSAGSSLLTSPWIRDAALVLETPEGWKLVVSSRDSAGASYADGAFASDVAALSTMAAAVGMKVIETPLDIQGGDVLFNGKEVLIGKATVVRNMKSRAVTREQVYRELKALYGETAEILEVDDPYNYHLDLWMTLLPGRRVIVGDPSMGARAMEEQLATAATDLGPDFYEKMWSEMIGKTKEMLGSPVSREQTQKLTKEYQPEIEARIAWLKQNKFEVIRVPVILGYRDPAVFNPVNENAPGRVHALASYNNAVFESAKIWLPQYGISNADSIARDIFGKEGFKVLPVQGAGRVMAKQGCLRCIMHKMASARPDSGEVWSKLRLAMADKLEENARHARIYFKIGDQSRTVTALEGLETAEESARSVPPKNRKAMPRSEMRARKIEPASKQTPIWVDEDKRIKLIRLSISRDQKVFEGEFLLDGKPRSIKFEIERSEPDEYLGYRYRTGRDRKEEFDKKDDRFDRMLARNEIVLTGHKKQGIDSMQGIIPGREVKVLIKDGEKEIGYRKFAISPKYDLAIGRQLFINPGEREKGYGKLAHAMLKIYLTSVMSGSFTLQASFDMEGGELWEYNYGNFVSVFGKSLYPMGYARKIVPDDRLLKVARESSEEDSSVKTAEVVPRSEARKLKAGERGTGSVGQTDSFVSRSPSNVSLGENRRTETRAFRSIKPTAAFRETWAKVFRRSGVRKLVQAWVVKPEAREIIAPVAEALGRTYSETNVASHMGGIDRTSLSKSQWYIAMELTQNLLGEAHEREIENPSLKKAITAIAANAFPGNVELTSLALEQRVAVQADLRFQTAAEWREFFRHYSAVGLATLKTLNEQLILDFNKNEVTEAQLKAWLTEFAGEQGAVLKPEDILFNGVEGEALKVGEVGAVLAQTDERVSEVPFSGKGPQHWYLYKKDEAVQKDADALAADVVTIQWAVRDERVDRLKSQTPEQYNHVLLAAVFAAIRAAQSFKQSA